MNSDKKYYPYYSPNFGWKTFSSFFKRKDAAESVINFFKKYTGKKYILITFSGRSALYLAYASLRNNGEVITSPLTCLTAILPIIYSQNTPIFADINLDTLNINPDEIEKKISAKTIAVQAIHFGGISCEIDRIKNICEKNKLLLIEDCAQGFGAQYKDYYTGTFGDISCFSLAKNLYGISGGVLATDDKNIFERAEEIQNNFPKASKAFLFYRLLRNILKTYSYYPFINSLLNTLILIKNKSKRSNKQQLDDLISYLKRSSKIIISITSKQLEKLSLYHTARKKNAEIYLSFFNDVEEITIPSQNNSMNSYVKFYMYSDSFNPETIKKLNTYNIEAKHLEEEQNVYYQKRFDNNELFDSKNIEECNNYLSIHDKLISLPLYEKMSSDDIVHIKNKVLEIIKKIK